MDPGSPVAFQGVQSFRNTCRLFDCNDCPFGRAGESLRLAASTRSTFPRFLGALPNQCSKSRGSSRAAHRRTRSGPASRDGGTPIPSPARSGLANEALLGLLVTTALVGALAPAATDVSAAYDGETIVTARLDEALKRRSWRAAGRDAVASRAPDGAWARRLHLDLIGRVPTVEELYAFIGDSAGRVTTRAARRPAARRSSTSKSAPAGRRPSGPTCSSAAAAACNGGSLVHRAGFFGLPATRPSRGASPGRSA